MFYTYRKGGLLVNNVLMAIAGIFLFAAKYAGSWEMLIIGRLIIGINSGLNAGIGNYELNNLWKRPNKDLIASELNLDVCK